MGSCITMRLALPTRFRSSRIGCKKPDSAQEVSVILQLVGRKVQHRTGRPCYVFEVRSESKRGESKSGQGQARAIAQKTRRTRRTRRIKTDKRACRRERVATLGWLGSMNVGMKIATSQAKPSKARVAIRNSGSSLLKRNGSVNSTAHSRSLWQRGARRNLDFPTRDSIHVRLEPFWVAQVVGLGASPV